MITETIFFSSFIGIVLMLGSKLAEERFGKFHYWSKMAIWVDHKVHTIIAFVIQKYRLYKKICFLFLFEFLPAYAYRKSIEFKDYMYRKYYEGANNLKGEKRMLRSNGTVSEFLQNITKDEKVDSLQSTDNSLDLPTQAEKKEDLK